MTPGGAPLITVVIPVHNGELYLAEAVDSALAQTYRPVEVVVVDDGSTDGTAEVAAGLGAAVRYVHQPNRGPGGAMNRGVALARGEYVAFLSADDVWAPEKLAGQMAALVAEPSLDLVFGHVQHFLSPELDDEVARTLHCPPDPMPACSAGTLLTRLETFRRVGNFDEQWRVGEFFDWYARARDLGLRMHVLPAVVSRRRVHGANLSHRTNAPATGYARVLKATLDRRRRQAGSERSGSCD